jgi:hypothetical protein
MSLKDFILPSIVILDIHGEIGSRPSADTQILGCLRPFYNTV